MTTTHKDPRAVIEQLVDALEYVSQFLEDDNAAMLHVPAALTAGREALKLRTCTWTQHDDVHMPSTYETECGELWSFVDGGPSDNKTKFCPCCGGLVCEPVGINGLTEAETSASMSVRGLSAPTVGLQSVHDAITDDPSLCYPEPSTPLSRFVNSSPSEREAIGNAAAADADAEMAKMTAPSTAGEPTHQGKNHEQQVRHEMGAVGGQQPMESASSGGNSSPTVLVSRIEALLALDAAGALVPHGIGGHARSLLKSAAALLQSTPDARPVGELTTCNCRWNGEEQVQSCTLHAAHVDAIHEWAERAKTAESELAAARTQPELVPNHTEQANAAHAAAANHTREIVKLVNAARNGITGGEQ